MGVFVLIINCCVSSVSDASSLLKKSLYSSSVLLPVAVEFDDSDGGLYLGVVVLCAP